MTTRRLLAAALLTSLLGGCTIHYHVPYVPKSGPGGGDPKRPQVLVGNGNIAIDQEVLRFSKDQRDVVITWRLVGAGKLTFPENGVVFERAAADEIVDCQRSKDLTEFSCRNRNSRPGLYRYGINVNEDGKPLKPLDPYVMNG